MTFRDWQQLSPADVARELHRRVRTLLPPAQQRAAIARLIPEEWLEKTLSEVDRSAPLAGVPYFLKDLFDVAGLPTLAGSTFLPEVRPTPTVDAAIVTALRQSGATLAGKTHLHEFAYGVTGENPHYGDCEHPHFPGRTTGGSSSGSAAIVSAGVVPLAIGSDTGGSVRVPAAFCGLHGFRLTPHDPFISDAFPLAPSFDTAGWFTTNAEDMLTTLRALIGVNENEAVTPRGCYLEMPGLDSDVALASREAAGRFALPADQLTATSLLHGFERSVETYSRIVSAEAWAVHAGWADRFAQRYDPVVRERLNLARAASSAEIAEARAAVEPLRRVWTDYFRTFDFLVVAASPFGALRKEDCTMENRKRILTLTAPASVGALPVVSLPVPLPSGLTAGLQIIVSNVHSPSIAWALKNALA